MRRIWSRLLKQSIPIWGAIWERTRFLWAMSLDLIWSHLLLMTHQGTMGDEMIARAPHVDAQDVASPIFTTNNRKVWENGRAAYKALYDHYLSASNANNVHTRAENISQLQNQQWMNTMNTNILRQCMSLLSGIPTHYLSQDKRKWGSCVLKLVHQTNWALVTGWHASLEARLSCSFSNGMQYI
jgi:hypothetical protein